jgi:RimJ/RimL family protein N-acetyltransferase
MASVVAETTRLVLARFSADDVDALAAIGTPEVVVYLGGTPWTAESAVSSIDLWQQIEARLGITTWAA